MADFAKLAEQIAAQRAAKAEASTPASKPKPSSTRQRRPRTKSEQAAVEPPAARPGRKPSADSKRTEWLARTFYVRHETAVRLKRHVMRCQLEGRGVADQSEAVDQALQAWLDQAERGGQSG